MLGGSRRDEYSRKGEIPPYLQSGRYFRLSMSVFMYEEYYECRIIADNS
jgi:hypothetical protein